MRQHFFIYGIILFLGTVTLNYYNLIGLFLPILILVILLIGFYNSLQKKHAILRNFPVLGYFRYLFELIAPEIQQYFIERSTDGKPFSSRS